ncbi:hypothetical protein [Bacillus sp. CDB3]|uniref:hypothetical protein n=1 Tax=Bacillus sp. CDB3 TaxID=360310 RepID=UPI0009D89122|nr:hypothetical protein [Bacillus sp. CDB3]OQR54809.1 hypothetical protein CDB3_22430 [Bacillus sp. CDB3]
MKLALKFNDGVKVTVENFSDLTRSIDLEPGKDVYDMWQLMKDEDKDIRISGENGETFHRTGKDLVAVELILN